jgi:hypothetical protein
VTSFQSIFRYPLLARELIERASRPRTYLARVLYGAAIYGLFGMALQRALQQQPAGGAAMPAFGFGYDLLRSLVTLLAGSLLLIQPAIMATCLTREKEQDSFGLLLLTRLSPTKILFEKYFAGLFPTATLLLLALPLAAVTMGYGGVSFQLLIAGGMVLVATWLMVGAWALLASAWCRTSLGALLFAYLGGAAVLFAAPLAYSVLQRDVMFGSSLIGVTVPTWLWALWPGEVFARLLDYQRETFSSVAGSGNTTAFAMEAVQRCGALFTAAAVFLIGARFLLLRRWVARPMGAKPIFLRLSKLLSFARQKIRQRPDDLPGDAPIAWREHSRSLLGGHQHFIYVAFLIWGGTFALSIFLLGLYPPTRGPERLQRVALFIGCLMAFVLVVTSVTSLLSERINRTLDILFTTPLGIEQLLRQKAQSVSRYWVLFGVMLAILFCAQAWSEYEYVRPGSSWQTFGQQWATGLIALLIYPPLVIWTSFLFAALCRKRARAIFTLLLFFAIWALVPLIVLEAVDPMWREEQRYLWYSLASPLGILDANANDRLPWFAKAGVSIGRILQVQGVPWVPVAVNSFVYGLAAFVARWLCLRSADRLLRK